MNQFYRALFMALFCCLSWTLTAETPPVEADFFTTCADRSVSNTTLCRGSNEGTNYGGFLNLDGYDNFFSASNGRFEEFFDGTARLTARWTNIRDSDIQFDVDIHFAGRTTVPPNDSPKAHDCLNANTNNFYYYTQTSGTLSGRRDAAGATINVTRFGAAFQIGVGANVTHNQLILGASGWLSLSVERQPSTGVHLAFTSGNNGQNGDININLSGDAGACLNTTGNITLNCPDDIVVTADQGQNSVQVTYATPNATTTCMVNRGTNCNAISNNIAGFEFIGEFNGSKYFCSDGNNFTWEEARQLSINNGGHLATVCSENENEFIRSNLLNEDAWIGYNDEQHEGQFVWDNGEPCTFTKWRSGEPNNSRGEEHFTRILRDENGQWTDRDADYETEFVMEIPCQSGMVPGDVMVSRTSGLSSGSNFDIGTTRVDFQAVDECGNLEECFFNVIVNPPVDPCANRGGDNDEDGVCAEDDCNDNNPNIGAQQPEGTACDDGDSNTVNDVIQADGCSCAGEVIDPCADRGGDFDGDGICRDDDCNDFNASVGAIQTPGTACDDGNPNTINDVIQDNGCGCFGLPRGAISIFCPGDIDATAAMGAGGMVVFYGQPNANTTCVLAGIVISQTGGPATGTIFPVGTTTVTFTVTDACDNVETCSFEVTVTEMVDPCANRGGDADGDGVCADDDCDDNNSDVGMRMPEGTACDDGNANTILDVFQADGCTCAGIPQGAISLACNEDITVTAPADATGMSVSFSMPTASTTCLIDGLTVSQTGGPLSGSTFPLGTTVITYTATDACGNTEVCSFNVTVEESSSTLAKVGDFVFRDNNGNGIQDDGEPGVENVFILLTNVTTGAIRFMTSGADGMYMFGDLEPGDYTIKFVGAPNDLIGTSTNQGGDDTSDSDIDPVTGITPVFTLGAGEVNNDIDAGFRPRNIEPTCSVDGGTISTNDDITDLCVDDGQPSIVNFSVSGSSGSNRAWVVTEADGTILNPDAPSSVNFEGAGPGTCRVYYVRYENVEGLAAGANINNLTGCFDLSNSISVSRIEDCGIGNPCDNAGGDSDGDGVCDDQDNCDLTPNPDQADNDGDGIGNVCDDTPDGPIGNTLDCNDAIVVGEAGKVTITNIATNAKIEISGPSTGWAQDLVCEGDCNTMEMINGLTAGDYAVTIQSFNPYCYNRVVVTVTDGTGNPCDGQGGDSDGDGICDNQDNCDFTSNPDQADNDGDGIGNVCDDTPNGNGNPCDGKGGDSDGDGVCDDQDNCDLTPNSDQADNDGDGIGNVCDDTPDGPIGSNLDCNDAIVVGEAGKVTITNIATNAKVEISGPSTGWGQDLVCEGNCGSMEMVAGLSAGDYSITIQTFNPYCYNRVTVTVTDGNGSPCDGQGGDSDGDGICDAQDNCDLTPNPDQADNDGDGIGNVCDDTPNGGGTTCSVNGGSISTNDNITDLCVDDGVPSIVNFTVTGSNGTNRAWVVTEADGTILNPDAPSSVNFEGAGAGACNVYYVRYDNISGLVAGGNVNNLSGCFDLSNRITVTRVVDCGNPTVDLDCNDAVVVGEAGKVTISNIAANAKVEISGPSTGWGQDLVCEGDCNTMEMINGLTAGDYAVTIQSFNPYCYNRVVVTVTDGNGNPCDGQGGDSDGDGVCDNQDNCDFTSNPDQADNDGDGIGNVCDDTPNGSGNPCDGKGGDSDGDGVCDADDNCVAVANPDQADNDNDGIGNVCDNTPNGEVGPDCDAVMVSAEPGKLIISNLTAPIVALNILDKNAGYGSIFECFNDCDVPMTMLALPASDYLVKVQFYSANWAFLCEQAFDVTVPQGVDPCADNGGDADGDGVCAADDCDDNNPNIGGQQAPGTSCNDGNPDTENDVIQGDGCACAGTPVGPSKCANRTVINTQRCGDEGIVYGFYLTTNDLEKRYSWEDGVFMEFDDGTAMLTGHIVNNGDSQIGFDVNINLTGRTTNSPTGDAKEHNCLDPDPSNFYYYADLTGTLMGTGSAVGAVLTLRDHGQAFQLGVGANVTNEALSFGASGWLKIDVQSQPSGNLVLDFFDGPTNGQNGDININLTGDGTECPNGASSRTTPGSLNILAENISVYPNPAQEELFINLTKYKGKSGNIKVLNLYGQLVHELKMDEITSDLLRLDLSNFQNGLYHLNIKVENAQPITKKILVSRLY